MTAPVVDTVAVAGTTQATSLTLAISARSIQIAIRARLMQDVLKLWPALDKARLSETFPGWLRAMILLTRNYHGQSSAAAASFYQVAREHAIQSPTPRSLIKFAPDPVEEWMTKAFGFSGPGMLSKDTARPGTALSTTLGTAARIALDGGRTTVIETVKADPVALGYYRLTDGNPCAFCALLASRGAVYKADTVDFQAHNDCGCMSAPWFSTKQPLPELNQTADRIYTEKAAGAPDQLAAFRKAWAEHQANSVG